MPARCASSGAYLAEVLIVDNDPDGGAHDLVRSWAGEGARYVHEATPGLSAARNRALSESPTARLLAFMDDDGRPDDGWLAELVHTWAVDRPAAVAGRVVERFEVEPDPWIVAGRFFRRRSLATHTCVEAAPAGNLLLDLDVVRRLGLRFDPRFGFSGGEDTLFTRRLTLGRRTDRLVQQPGSSTWCRRADDPALGARPGVQPREQLVPGRAGAEADPGGAADGAGVRRRSRSRPRGRRPRRGRRRSVDPVAPPPGPRPPSGHARGRNGVRRRRRRRRGVRAVTRARRAARTLKAALRRHAWVGGSITATTSPDLVLTLDDGPDPVETPKVLAALEAHGASATFFVLLTRVRRHPELLQAVVAAGHEVALHGLDHRALTTFGAREAAARTSRGKDELEAAAGTPVRWFRPPYGAPTPASWAAARTAGLVPVLWNGTTWDWKDVPDGERRAKAVESVRPGAILLAHDGIAGAGDGVPAAHVPLVERARLLGQVLDVAGERGLTTRSLGAALAEARPVRTLSFEGPARPEAGRGVAGSSDRVIGRGAARAAGSVARGPGRADRA